MALLALNLARKWRSANFDGIVGQPLVVKMLKNSLFLGQVFPVYLLAGRHGCGKTSIGRIFAAAVNCEKLEDFRVNPRKVSIPCLECNSCKMMKSSTHPDFIEIDAASHTGVDNIRQIVDSASFIPIMGEKKIYLVDEAHMLSKAAFNAFLKILEEPSNSVFFMLATTEPEKIIDTVRSRCFQLFFKSVETNDLYSLLEKICNEEKISYDKDALSVIADAVNGCVRDSINLLEQVRFAGKKVTSELAFRVLGEVAEENILELLLIALFDSSKKMVSFLDDISFVSFSAPLFFKKLCKIIHELIMSKYGVKGSRLFSQKFVYVSEKIDLKKLISILDLLLSNEIKFLRTLSQHSYLEMLLIKVCELNESDKSEDISFENKKMDKNNEKKVLSKKEKDEVNLDVQKKSSEDYILWNKLLEKLESVNDPLVNSVFAQAKFSLYDNEKNSLIISFPKIIKPYLY